MATHFSDHVARRFPTITRRSVTMDAAALIKDMILDGRLHPGHRLPSERTLSEALGVSRPSVREAIRSLVAMHILETRHGSGTVRFLARASTSSCARCSSS